MDLTALNKLCEARKQQVFFEYFFLVERSDLIVPRWEGAVLAQIIKWPYPGKFSNGDVFTINLGKGFVGFCQAVKYKIHWFNHDALPVSSDDELT